MKPQVKMQCPKRTTDIATNCKRRGEQNDKFDGAAADRLSSDRQITDDR